MSEQTPELEPSDSIAIYVDDAAQPIATYRAPARFSLDTTTLSDGEHVLRIVAVDAAGNVGVRRVPFTVANGPGITITGLRPGSRVRGSIEVDVNAFGANEPFDPVRAESSGPVPVWTWVFFAIVVAWAAWYGIEYFPTPQAFAKTPTYAQHPALAAANAPAPSRVTPAQSGKSVAGFDYASLGAQVYAQNCQACHGATGTGVPGTFPSLASDPVVNGPGGAQIHVLLHGLSGKVIGGTHFAAQMPAFGSQLSDPQIAAVIDHERTSWGNHGALVTPEEVRAAR